MALAASFVSTHVYYASLEEGEKEVMDQSVAWTIVGGLSSSALVGFIAFLLLMKRTYLSTFFSLQTGHEWVKHFFVTGTTDAKKMRTLLSNKKQWLSIRDDVKAWTLENWERWEEEKPAFFTAAFKASVDDDMIPPASLRKLNGGGSERRRSSLGDVLGVGARVAPVGGGGAQ
jgi:hypothetical protein